MITEKDTAIVHIKKVMYMIDKLTGNGYRSAESVFVDFLTLSACSYSNVFDLTNKETREKRYLDIVKKYKKEELNYFSTALGELAMAAEIYLQHGYIKDILGYIYTSRQYYKKAMGQYFTPENIAIFMTEIINGDFKQLEKEDFISVSEPTCGSGVMILAFAQNMLKKEINYQNSMFADAWDLDQTCALMAYVQFSIYNIPAIVTHGDSLSLKAYSKWITPMYFINDFPGKQKRKEMIDALRKLLIDPDQSSKNNSHLQIEESAIAATSDIDMQSIREKFELQSLFFAYICYVMSTTVILRLCAYASRSAWASSM